MKIDLHVHSRFSTRPSQWVLQKLGCQECYTEPQALYRIAKERGMSQVTITDHNVIDGCLEIAHLPDTFISEEVTTYFPEDGCKVHVLVYDLTEAEHLDIQKVRESIFELAAYLQEKNLVHSLAHPFWAVNGRLTTSHFEKLLLLFKNFELNGGRDGRLNDWLKMVLSLLTPQDLEAMAEIHGITPDFTRPWEKRFTGGSDDHSSVNIARMFTEVEGVETLTDFFQGLAQGQGRVRGQASTPLSLGHNIYSIAYQFYKSKYDLENYVSSNDLLSFIEKHLHKDNVKLNGGSKIYYYLNKIKGFISNSEKNNVFSMIKKETYKVTCPEDNSEIQWYAIINQITQSILKQFNRRFRKALIHAHFIDLLNLISSKGIIYLGLAPYFAAFSSFAADRKLGAKIMGSFLEKKLKTLNGFQEINLAHFTDTFYEINGVSLTLHKMVEAALEANKQYTLITCDQGTRPARPGISNFAPLGVFHLPEYHDQKLFHPPILEILKFCHEKNFSHMLAATPGPMGLTALASARLLKLPIWGTYHTALPQFAQFLTEDSTVVAWMWKYILWFYSQMDVIFAPSQSTAAELIASGIEPKKIKVYPRGVDLERFHPGKRNGFLESRFGLEAGIKLLYVGRVSKEKNLEMLGRVFRVISRNCESLHLVVVGDGPYLKEMQQELAGSPVTFTGYLEGEDLAAIYASCDLFVFPSTTDTFGNVVLEAQASGIPVIVSHTGGPKENIIPDKTGLIIPGDNEEGLARAIVDLASHPERLQLMGQAARAYVESRSFEDAFKATWEMYKEISLAVEPGKDFH